MSDPSRGKLKVFLGYAAGSGKTYQMLEEAHRLQAEGTDVVVGYFEPHGRVDTIAKASGLELVPRKTMAYRGSQFEEMDTEAIVARRPTVCAVDEFPHTNVPGSERTKRWEDVEYLRDQGIDVLTTMNIQHLESLNDQVFQLTGIRMRETIPDWVVERADEVVMVDVTPRALLNRLERGVVYGREKAERALQNFFRESTLVSLREMALRQTAHEVEQRQEPDDLPQQRILVYVTPDPGTPTLIRRARRVADFLRAECFAVAVCQSGMCDSEVQESLNFARDMRIETRVIESDHVAEALVEFARLNHVTQIFLSKPEKRPRFPAFRRDTVQRIVEIAPDIQVVITAGAQPRRRSLPGPSE